MPWRLAAINYEAFFDVQCASSSTPVFSSPATDTERRNTLVSKQMSLLNDS